MLQIWRYVENGPNFVLKLDDQVEPVTMSNDLVKSLHAMIDLKLEKEQIKELLILEKKFPTQGCRKVWKSGCASSN